MLEKIINLFGWYGVVAILLAYALISFSVIDSNNLLFQLLNGTGAVGLAIISLRKKAYQPGVLNIVWAVIAVIAMIIIILNR